MSIQAAQFAATFERLGQRMLAQLESLPEAQWDRAPLIHHSDSLLTLATRFLDESDHWVLVVVGGREGGEPSLEASAPGVRATLLQRYERWVTEMHRVLGRLPDAIMNLFVAVPPAYRETVGAASITVRACLLYALEQSGLLLGRIECLGQVLAEEREALRHEVIAAGEIDSRPDLRACDVRETTNGGRAGGARNRPSR